MNTMKIMRERHYLVIESYYLHCMYIHMYTSLSLREYDLSSNYLIANVTFSLMIV